MVHKVKSLRGQVSPGSLQKCLVGARSVIKFSTFNFRRRVLDKQLIDKLVCSRTSLNPVTYLYERGKVSNKFDFLLSLQELKKAFLESAVSTRSMKETEGSRNSAEKELITMQ